MLSFTHSLIHRLKTKKTKKVEKEMEKQGRREKRRPRERVDALANGRSFSTIDFFIFEEEEVLFVYRIS